MIKHSIIKTCILDEINRDRFRKNLSRFTWQAFNTLPKLPEPIILDIGCGTGVPTIDLAVQSKGRITAIDTDSKALKKLKNKIKALHLTGHIKTKKCSLDKLRFKKNHFDIIWSEGSISFIGFEKGLKEWRNFIKPKGYLVVHDEINDFNKKLNQIPKLNYSLINYFVISEHVWLKDYFKPFEKKIKELKEKYRYDKEALEIINEESIEIEKYRESSKDFASVFYILQKI